MNLISIIDKSILCSIWVEGEIVIGTFVKNRWNSLSGIAFESSICPHFIKRINKNNNETEESGMTGFYAQVTDIKVRTNDETDENQSYISFNDGKTFHRVNILRVDGCTIINTPGILPKD